MIRMRLADAPVAALHFDLAARRLTVDHDGDPQAILACLVPLGYGAELAESRALAAGEAQAAAPTDDAAEARVLWTLLAINALMFVVELGAGLWARSAGLIADAMDMFADAAVYGVALYAVGRAARHKLAAARTLYEFDDVFTAPLHGFRDTEEYWARASAKPHLARIRIPALVINALNDPFVPADSLPRAGEVGRWVQLWQPPHGGHVGFVEPASPLGLPGHVLAMPHAVGRWLLQQAGDLPLREGGREGEGDDIGTVGLGGAADFQ